MVRLQVGIIGMGGAGRAHASRFLPHPKVTSVVGFDPKEVDFNTIEILSDFEVFMDRVDAVSICAPDTDHYGYIVECLRRGKHVLVEKPMVSTYAEAVALESPLSRVPELIFAVHHQMRFVPAFSLAKQLVEDGALGELFYLEANYWHDMRERNTEFDDWRIQHQGQSVLLGAACHPLDLLLYLVDREVESHTTYVSKNAYTAYPGLYTSATSLIKFQGGIIAKCHTNNCAVFPQHNTLVVLGSEGSYVDGILYHGKKFRRASQYYAQTRGGQHRWGIRALCQLALTERVLALASQSPLFRGTPFSVYNHDVACATVIDNFLRAVLNREPVLVGYRDACRVIKLCEEMEADGLAQQVVS